MAQNWDLLVLAVALAAAFGADLHRGLRARDFVVAGPDSLVVRVRGTTSSWAWSTVAGVEHEPRRRLRPGRAVLRLADGTRARLPRDAPVHELARWARELGGRG